MADRIVKPDTGNDLVLQNDDASAKIEINEAGTVVATPSVQVDNIKIDGNSITSTDSGGHINITPNGAGRAIVTNANLTSPQLSTAINDSSDKELIKVTSTSNAVNEITIANAATSGVPSITGSGDDSSVSLLLDCKGNGEVIFGANTNFSSKTDGKIQLPSAGGVFESDGSTEILTESSGTVTLKNTAIDSTNTLTNATFPDGFILQVKSTTISGALVLNPSESYIDVTGLSVQITPSSTSNKIMFFASVQGGSASNVYAFLRVARTIGSTTEAVGVGDTRSARSRAGAGFKESTEYDIESANWQFLDTPNTTSQITYKVQTIANGSVQINKNRNDGDAISNPTAISTLTVMEIKQ